MTDLNQQDQTVAERSSPRQAVPVGLKAAYEAPCFRTYRLRLITLGGTGGDGDTGAGVDFERPPGPGGSSTGPTTEDDDSGYYNDPWGET